MRAIWNGAAFGLGLLVAVGALFALFMAYDMGATDCLKEQTVRCVGHVK